MHDFADSTNLPFGPVPKYGQDLTFGTKTSSFIPSSRYGVTAYERQRRARASSVGTTEAELKPKMEKLLSIFASSDKSGMAKRLFAQFLAKQANVIYFDDRDLNEAAAAHANIKFFCGGRVVRAGNFHPTKSSERCESTRLSNRRIGTS